MEAPSKPMLTTAPQSPVLAASSPPAQSPEIRPVTAPYNAIPTVSPPLDAVSAPSVAGSTAPSMNDWMRGGYAGSPGNLISLMGESPPTQPSSYEDSTRLHHGWGASRSHVGSHGVSPSPPGVATRRPFSMQMDPSFRLSDANVAMATNMQTAGGFGGQRRNSVHSQFSHARNGSHPPLPHQAQAHFYGAPEIDFGALVPQSGMKAGERGYFFGFDTLPRAYANWAAGATGGSEDVVLAGYEGGLEVYAVSKRGLDHVGGLKGLRGGVYNAKVLPWTAEHDAAGIFPLIAVVVHGPVLPPAPTETTPRSSEEEDDEDEPRADGGGVGGGATSAPAPSMPGSPRPESVLRDRPAPVIDSYQTTVEIYSLRTNKLLTVLLATPKSPISTAVSILSPLFKPPPPTGALHLKADAGTILVASGTTGECWVYRQFINQQANGIQFGCIAKFWTSIQQNPRGDVNEEREQDHLTGLGHQPASVPRSSPQTPIVTLGGRWIAYCPSAPSSQIALRAHIPVAVFGKAPGLGTVTAPHLPSVTAATDLPISESVVNKIMRETTQELILGAKWVGQQGRQAWNSYWNKSSGQPTSRSPPGPQLWTQGRHDQGSQFPPTHGASEQVVAKEPGLVSILDIESLSSVSSSLHPLTTFAPPLGCSFLSFSPTGLALFTASTKGDVQTVWDLMRLQFTKSSPLQASTAGTSNGPLVRQIAQFSRMTVARIVDVAWVKPRGQRLAVVTERGTVHLLDMPPGALSWPPPRRRKPTDAGAARSDQPGSTAVSIASSALGAAFGVAKPLINRQRRSSGNAPAFTGTAIVDSANQGGRAIAATISSSLGKTGNAINQLRHNGENRVSLPSSSMLPGAPCAVWITGRKFSTLCVVGDGMVRVFAPKPRRTGAQSSRRRVPKAGKHKDFRVQSLPDGFVAPWIKNFLELGAHDEYLDLSDKEDGIHMLTADARPRIGVIEAGTNAEAAAAAAIPYVEIESSAPYQPFHTDRRVALLEYSSETPASHIKKKKGGRVAENAKAWAFGQTIKAVKLDLGHPPLPEDSTVLDGDHRALPVSAMERVMHMGQNEEEIVVTTRKRRRHHPGGLDEDGFFEDDCEILDFADQRV
jgi:hypothetical protein